MVSNTLAYTTSGYRPVPKTAPPALFPGTESWYMTTYISGLGWLITQVDAAGTVSHATLWFF